MGLSEHVVLIGACGWRHSEWTGEFYPDDLPEDWQLGYYGNEYQVVMVPADYWTTNPDTYEQWLEESDDSLRMICEWPSDASQEQQKYAMQGIHALSDRVLAVLIPLQSRVVEEELAIYKELADRYPLCFDVVTEQRDKLLAWLADNFDGQDIGICWHGEPTFKQDLSRGSVSITRIEGEIDLKIMRGMLETILTESQVNRHMILIVDGEPPSMQTMTNAGIILDLL